MTAQRHLFDPGPADGGLTAYQSLVYESVGVEGITASRAGALIHSHRAIHPATDLCQWCRGDGNGVLQALRKRGLVKRRRTGTWQLVRQKPGLAPGQTIDIPF